MILNSWAVLQCCQQHGASVSTKCVIKATGGGAFKYANLFKENLGISLDKADEMDCLVAGANFLLKVTSLYGGPLEFMFIVKSTEDHAYRAVSMLLLELKEEVDVKIVVAGIPTTCSQKIHNRLAAADDRIQVIDMIKLLETKGSKTF